MDKLKSAFGLAPTILLGVLSVAYVLEWRASREEASQLLKHMSGAMDGFGKRQHVHATRWTALLERIRNAQDALLAQGKGTFDGTTGIGPSSTTPAAAGRETQGTAPVTAEKVGEAEQLPPLPPGIQPARFLEEWDAAAFFQDQRWNPDQKELTRAQKNRAVAEVTYAKSMADVLNAQVRAEVAEGMEKMRAAGSFVEYGQGERPVAVSGVFTSGEETEERGMRLYYFYPEEFPGIYQKRQDKRIIVETAVRRLLSLFKD